MSVYTIMSSPVGELVLVGEPVGAGVVLTGVSMVGGKRDRIRDGWVERPGAFAAVVAQLNAYFAGERTGFDLELGGGGSEFQRRVWEALDAVPYGTTVTYGEIAARIGAPRAAVRAVGAAIGANPLMIVRPCHRVVGANGALTGYAGGVERKQRLLELEHAG
ncbi:methylated-DNA--[protein]-cysteine S-methyltransferase [Nocardia terpenica]|uniref:methylated-DNA--[protein]-cysteine S-methyltransferase n=1 Tax=Nocardia terpenica TaxID=455432 RepID=UPI001895E73E|nr:methylated-DNA--[protein]-cysteine S-methyltransferase [Nocardia terpenica]MBF6063629.1 methylated-DNA--[protein]-cysteine S-methyltransferase [Nocardia terpenica]MBF6107005.1 methylated-DNA--[protein]-cysteine S-methyltransferase [Nocardia terpenica]MBF6114178.1 methylated-DNA--[protein]-cysteine S-methyltransferase [Nocardia terpenica]MBF6121735.1 methylated-DNA--[protein]-cysteine S-methyltransferase [Nocardia terpenica]MBF6154150.1 methylated-DNA--[protein]-cysteine S-methyltransferase 